MFAPVARSRRTVASLLLLSLVPFASCQREEVLFTSSVSYCAPAQAILIQRFDVSYISANNSVSFNISAASVEPGLNVTANLFLNVYGMQPLNLTIDLCNILGGALCPLPTYNFTGADSISLPSSVDVSRVPGIAYKIPDLEAFAQLTLREIGTGDVKACVQSTLSNRWSTRQLAVEWTTGGMAILALLSALWQSVSPEALAPFRLLDLMTLFQTIGVSGLLNLNYPSLYRSFTLNFAWSLGLFGASAKSNVQNAIDNMRHRTGGTMPDASGGDAVDLVNRKLSPYNVPSGQSLSVKSLLVSLAAPDSGAKLVRRDVVTVTSGSSNVLEAGIPVYVNSLGIATANAFMSVFITALILAAIALGVLAIGWAILCVVLKYRRRKGAQSKLQDWRCYYPWFAKAWGLRLSLIAFLPITLFAFYQWTLKDSWLSILLSVIAFLAICALVVYPTILSIRIVRHSKPWTLFTHTQHVLSHGPLYVQYRHQRWYFFILLLAAAFVRALVVAFGHAAGLAQVIVLLIVELAVLGALLVLRPHETRGGDVLATFLAIVRVAIMVLLFVFVESFAVKPIPRVAVGIVAAVIFSVAVVVMFFNTLVNLGIQRLWKDRYGSKRRGCICTRGLFGARWGTRLGSVKSGSPNASVLEKGDSVGESITQLADNARPQNPTPQRMVPLDPRMKNSVTERTPTPTPTTPSGYTSTELSYPSPLPSSLPTASSYGYGPRAVESESEQESFGTVLPRRREYEGLGWGVRGYGGGEGGVSPAPSTSWTGTGTGTGTEEFVTPLESPAGTSPGHDPMDATSGGRRRSGEPTASRHAQ